MMKGSEEKVVLTEGVLAEGNIEEWLVRLEKEMQKSVREICFRGAQDCHSMPLRDFIDAYPSQVALLGIQMLWTSKVGECLEKNKKDQGAELEKKKRDINNIMGELTQLCLENMNDLKR